jgi:hypothetical protein
MTWSDVPAARKEDLAKKFLSRNAVNSENAVSIDRFLADENITDAMSNSVLKYINRYIDNYPDGSRIPALRAAYDNGASIGRVEAAQKSNKARRGETRQHSSRRHHPSQTTPTASQQYGSVPPAQAQPQLKPWEGFLVPGEWEADVAATMGGQDQVRALVQSSYRPSQQQSSSYGQQGGYPQSYASPQQQQQQSGGWGVQASAAASHHQSHSYYSHQRVPSPYASPQSQAPMYGYTPQSPQAPTYGSAQQAADMKLPYGGAAQSPYVPDYYSSTSDPYANAGSKRTSSSNQTQKRK